MFYLTAGIYVLGAVVFVICARGTVISWADDKSTNITEDCDNETAKDGSTVENGDSSRNGGVTD